MSKDSWNQFEFMNSTVRVNKTNEAIPVKKRSIKKQIEIPNSSTRLNKALKFYKKESPADMDHIETFRTDEEGK